MSHRVMVTGVGAITAAGSTAGDTWNAMVTGQSAIGPITAFDPTPFRTRVQGEVHSLPMPALFNSKRHRHIGRCASFAVIAATEAILDSGLVVTDENAESVGVVFGSGSGSADQLLHYEGVRTTRGVRHVSPFLPANYIVDAASGHVAIAIGARGPNHAVVSACATGSSSIGEAFEVIRRGDALAMVAGSSEAILGPVHHAGWASMNTLADEPPFPSAAMKPFDLNRSGFVPGEGAACLILEDMDYAVQRGARIYCEATGYGSANDAFDMVLPHPAGRGLEGAMRSALGKAGAELGQIDYINPHGSATRVNDALETAVIKRVFGHYSSQLAISSVKPIVGHCFGAAGAIEAVATVLAIYHSVIPPTINYKTPDPQCDLDYVPNISRTKNIRNGMSISIGLGGHNSCLVFSRLNDDRDDS